MTHYIHCTKDTGQSWKFTLTTLCSGELKHKTFTEFSFDDHHLPLHTPEDMWTFCYLWLSWHYFSCFSLGIMHRLFKMSQGNKDILWKSQINYNSLYKHSTSLQHSESFIFNFFCLKTEVSTESTFLANCNAAMKWTEKARI